MEDVLIILINLVLCDYDLLSSCFSYIVCTLEPPFSMHFAKLSCQHTVVILLMQSWTLARASQGLGTIPVDIGRWHYVRYRRGAY